MAEFLFEIGLEEVPARMIAAAEAELVRRTLALLERERLITPGTANRSYSTPRRLAVWVGEVAAAQPDATEELLGPSAKIAFKDGAPTPAALAFAKKAGVAVESLRTVTTPKGEYVAATSTKPGRSAAEVLVEELPKELAAIYWAKNMYWRRGKPERFVRPVRWLVCLLGEAVVPVVFAGKTAGNLTFGHRVLHGEAAIPITGPDDYAAALERAHVIADVEVRRQRIRKSLDAVCRTISGARWREDHPLVDKLTHLTEWPTVISGGFDGEFLKLPEEVLVTVMRDHQNYFAVEDAEGRLAPYFLAVLNTQADAAGEETIRHGNERVLRARFNDARFFWEFDQRVPLTARVALLENVTFQKDLGSYAAKSKRVEEVARRLAELVAKRGAQTGIKLNAFALDQAAQLAKTDLTTELVKEFTELQGEIGGLYARAQGHPAAVAEAIYDHYRPVSMEDRIPRTAEGQLLSVADKADTIAGMFSLGLEPTGSKDPFALRRAANGIVKVLAEATPALPLTLGDVADAATPEPAKAVAPSAQEETLRRRIEVFLAERLEFYLREARGQAYDVVAAVLAAGANDVPDAIARAEALTAVRGSADFAAVSASFKRIKNILSQAKEKGILVEIDSAARPAEVHPAQAALDEAAEKTGGRFTELAEAHNYGAALELLATLRGPIDRFFDEVMVMDPDAAVRASRLRLLRMLVGTFSRVADFSEIVTPGS